MSEEEKNLEYDFQKSIDQENLSSFLEQKTDEVKTRLSGQKKHRNYSWAVVFLLMVSLVGIGTYSLIELKQKDVEIAKLKSSNQQSVAGVSEDTYNRISGESFTIVLNEETPQGYEQSFRTDYLKFFNNKKAATTTFLAQKEADENLLLSGIEVSVFEYDGVFDKDAFNEMYLENLGEEYSINPEKIEIPKNVTLTKIVNSNKDNGVVYYTAITQNNYYIIKVYNQTSNYPELAQYSRFVESLVNNLYLN